MYTHTSHGLTPAASMYQAAAHSLPHPLHSGEESQKKPHKSHGLR